MADRELLFVPLGGVGEIGMNLALYGVRTGDDTKWLMVDCGMTFPEGASLPGVDVIFPDIRFAEEEKRNLVGLVLTHGHEDHIGAILDLWPRLKCKIHATPFTAGLIEAKASEEGISKKIPVSIVPVGGRITLGPFDVEFLPVAHSIPESHALAIRTAAGNALHTGDWKIDPTPPLGDVTALDRFAAFGAEGIDALIGDSTNAVRDGRSPSEAEVAKVLRELMADAPGRVAVTLFASNIGRVTSIAEAAEAAGRDVVLLGRALDRNVTVAREIGYLKHVRAFLDMDAYGYLPRDKVCAIMTGSQGEERSMLARVSRGDHPHIAFSPGDRVIFSSRVIPGNERPVGEMLNGLVRQGVDLITDRTHLVHVSGHPRADEIKQLYDLVKPRAVLPVHGEAIHMDAHAKLAKAAGVPQTLLVDDGAMVRLAPGPAEIIDWVPAGRVFRDGKLLLSEEDTDTVPQRRRLMWSGVVSVAIAMGSKGEIVGDPDVKTTGVPDKAADGTPMLDIIDDAIHSTIETMPKARRKDGAAVEEAVLRGVRSALDQAWGKKPTCHVIVLPV